MLLLGGPNTYIQGMQDCWKLSIPKIWDERKLPLPEGVDPASLILMPENAQYFAALGSVEFGKDEDEAVGVYRGTESLAWYMNVGRLEEKQKKGGSGLSKTSRSWRSSSKTTASRSSRPRRSSRARWWKPSSASTAARRRPKPSCSIRTRTSW